MNTAQRPRAERQPAVFIAHGAPFLLDDTEWVNQLHSWSQSMARPKAVLMLSAHWDQLPLQIGATRTVPLVYDFYGFPERYYKVQYASPGAPELAARVRELLRAGEIAFAESPERGLDHGAYVPLIAMYPEADVPVLQISLPGLSPQALFTLGQKLAPLRDEGVLIAGSGFLTHNMSAFMATTPQWASEFDAWIGGVLARRDVDALLDYQARGPAVHTALPTVEHFVPVIAAMGASADRPEQIAFPITGFMGGSFTKRSVQFG
ncbi:MAG: dioxygenase [Sandaracinaceae bacterium]|nr:dioxygenase [Sandaracinaceae bacterium]